MKIQLKDAAIKDKGDYVAKFFLNKTQSEDVSIIFVECRRRHYKTMMKGAKRMYFILDGTGTFTINDKTEQIARHDLFVITDGETYEYEGQMNMLEINVPATDKSHYENLESL
jgi:mannose-6-phosphate isomerase-like protein (cupin superfamily)